MADLDELALALPQATRELSDDGRPAYKVHDKVFLLHRSRRPDAVDPETGERLDDVLMFRVDGLEVKELLMEAAPDIYYQTEHYHGWAYLLVRLDVIGDEELSLRVEDAWRHKAPKTLAATRVKVAEK